MNEQDHRIHSPELAHYMGYAEKPFRDLAAQAIALGMQAAHDEALGKAEAAGLKAGRDYVNSLHTNLSHYDAGHLEMVEGKAMNGLPGFNEAHFRTYAEAQGLPKSTAARSFNGLARSIRSTTPFAQAIKQQGIKLDDRTNLDEIPVDVLLNALLEVAPGRPGRGPSPDSLTKNFQGIGQGSYSLIVDYCHNVIEQAGNDEAGDAVPPSPITLSTS